MEKIKEATIQEKKLPQKENPDPKTKSDSNAEAVPIWNSPAVKRVANHLSNRIKVHPDFTTTKTNDFELKNEETLGAEIQIREDINEKEQKESLQSM